MKEKKEKTVSIEEIEKYIEDAGSDNLGVFGGTYEGGIHCQQVPDEIAPCIATILEYGEKIRYYLEIGVAAGGTTYLMNHFFHPEIIVLIDDNKHHKAGLRGDILKGINYQEIICNSQSEDAIAKTTENAPFDIILIDGDHNYVAVKLDTILYLPFLRKGGFLVFHDSAMPQWGVQRTVKELKTDKNMKFIGEFISKKHPTPLGVALFQKVNE